MKLVKKGEGSPDQAPGHCGQSGIRMLAAGQDTQRASFIISHFVPGVALTMAPRRMSLYATASPDRCGLKTRAGIYP